MPTSSPRNATPPVFTSVCNDHNFQFLCIASTIGIKSLGKKGQVAAVRRKANARVSSIQLFVDQLHGDLPRV